MMRMIILINTLLLLNSTKNSVPFNSLITQVRTELQGKEPLTPYSLTCKTLDLKRQKSKIHRNAALTNPQIKLGACGHIFLKRHKSQSFHQSSKVKL